MRIRLSIGKWITGDPLEDRNIRRLICELSQPCPAVDNIMKEIPKLMLNPFWRRFHGKESSPLEAIRELG